MTIGVEIDWNDITYNLIRMIIAFSLSIPIAWNREKQTRSVGLRTYPLVAIGACAFVLTGISMFSEPEPLARVVHGVVTGMGFIGGGAILKGNGKIQGLANAASLWCTGALGAAVALNRFEIAILLSLCIPLVFAFKDNVGEKAIDKD